MNKNFTLLSLIFCLLIGSVNAQISITTAGTAYTENFDALPTTGKSGLNPYPAGWYRYAKPLSPARDSILTGTGSSATGGFYSVGASASSERAFGLLLASAIKPLYLGAKYTNNTGAAITSVDISYNCEQWRRGNNIGVLGHADSLMVEYNYGADSVQTGSWTNVPELMGLSVNTDTIVTALDGNTNSSTKSFTITGLNIPNGTTFWIRFNDKDVQGSEDMLAVDDYSATFQTGTVPACTIPSAAPTNLVLTPTSSSISGSFTNSGSADGYLVVYSTSNTLGAVPNNTTSYTTGTSFGSGTVVQSSGSNTFNVTGLSPTTPYYFFVFAYNGACTGGPLYFGTPLTGNSTTTAVVVPDCTQPTGVSNLSIVKVDSTSSSITINFTLPGNADSVMVLAGPTGTIGFVTIRDSVYYAQGSTVPGTGATVYYRGTGSSNIVLSPLVSNTVYKILVVSFNNKGCSNGPNYAGVATTTIKTASGAPGDCVQPTGVSNLSIIKLDSTATTISLKYTLPSNADSVMVLAGPTATVGFVTLRDSIFYPVGSIIPGSQAKVYYRGTDSSLILTGLIPNTVYKILISTFNNKACNYGPNYSGVATTTIRTAVATGIKYNSAEAEFTMYPNPVSNGVLNLKFKNVLKEEAFVQIVDVAGRILSIQKITSGNNTQTLDISNLSKGTYLLNVVYKGSNNVTSFVIQ